MSTRQRHGAPILRDGSAGDLPVPGTLRLAIEVIAEGMDIDASPQHLAAWKALNTLHAHLWAREMDQVAKSGLSSHYLIIRPVNPLHMPGPEVMAEIRDAIATLARHGLLYGTGDDQ